MPFPLNGNKIIITSGGGMLVSAEEALVQRARFLARQARDPAPHYEHSVLGNNYRLSNLLAAVGRGQLRVLPQRVERRRQIFTVYQQALGCAPGITFMPEANSGKGHPMVDRHPGRSGGVRRHAGGHPPASREFQHRGPSGVEADALAAGV